ncbi:MAG: hypothetical protein OER95_05010 [Acidimicrobiia bacterium]|nr:hypothetical protein [Acidimicrobiia bacterium]
MNGRRTFAVLFWGAMLAIAIAIPSGDRRFSVEIWFAVFTVWALGAVTIRLLIVTPVSSTSNIGLWRWFRRLARDRRSEENDSLLGPRAAQNLLRRSLASERAHTRHLRPRLQTLAQYYLPIHHGIDPVRQADRARAVLGPVYWLIDDTVDYRRPTATELEQFFDLVVGDTELAASRTQRTGVDRSDRSDVADPRELP